MSSRGASSPDNPRLVGTYPIDGGYVSVTLTRPAADRYLLAEERFAGPGRMVRHRDVSWHEHQGEAEAAAQMRVLSNAGLLGHEAEAIACAPLDPWVAEDLFAARRMDRFLHVPARPLAG